MLTVALSHLLRRGVRLETHEAVALARELLAHPCGMPTPENIQLGSDGSASCIIDDGTPSVAQVAELLMSLLPAGTANVPAALRYAIARGLEAVEAPPFVSASDFSNALRRFEQGPSREVLSSLLQRGARPAGPVTPPSAVTPAPVTPPAASTLRLVPRPAPVPVRRTFVVGKPAVPGTPLATGAPTTKSSGAGMEANPTPRPTRQRALVAAAAVIASFGVGFAVADGIADRRAAAQQSASGRVTSGPSTSAPPVNDSARGTAGAERRDEIVLVPHTVAADGDAVASAAPARIDAAKSAPTEAAVHLVTAIRDDRGSHKNAFSPAFAADGATIFFHTGRTREARSAIEVAGPGIENGGNAGVVTIVDDGSHNSHAQPSPDGRFVAFDSDRDGQRAIYVADRNGSQVRRVSGAGYAALPTWSRNNQWLAYIRAEPHKPSVWNLWVQPVAGGAARRVTSYRYGQTWAASWFPDDRRIAYSHEDTLVVMDLQTAETTHYRTPVKGQLVRTPAVSPDGTKIIFQVFRRGVWLLELADGSMRRVLSDPTAEEFAWSPDGRQVAFHSRRNGQWRIYVLSHG